MDSYKKKSKYLTKEKHIGFAIINFIVGEHIGSGMYRDVFHYNLDKNYVVKIENSEGQADNWVEWRIWQEVRQRKDGAKDWFAECSWISVCGKIMIQKKTAPLFSKEKKIPETIPAYFTDIKESNFGWINNHLVCHDYSHCIEKFSSIAITNKTQPFKKELYK